VYRNTFQADQTGGGKSAKKTTDYVANTSPATSKPKPKSKSKSSSSSFGKTKITAAPAYTPVAPELRGLTLGDLYGINYDEDAIRSKFDEATRAEYATRNKEYQMTENAFYNNLYGTQAAALDTIRRNASQAIATGASRGMQAANELSAILGLTQEGVMGSTDLAQKRNLLKDQEAAAYARNAMEALEISNALRQQIGALDAQNYAAEIQHSIGEMDYYARLDQALKQLQGMQAQAAAQRYAADRNVEAQRILADANLQAANIDAQTRKELADAQRMPGFNELFEQALASGNDALAIAHLMNYTNMSRSDARKIIKQTKKNNRGSATSSYSDYNYTYPYPWLTKASGR